LKRLIFDLDLALRAAEARDCASTRPKPDVIDRLRACRDLARLMEQEK